MSAAVAVCARVLLYVGALVAIGEVVAAWIAARASTSAARFTSLALLLSVALLFVAQSIALELPFTQSDVAMLVRETAWGRGWLMLTVCALVVSALSFASATSTMVRAIRTLSAVALAIAMSGLGHSAADDQPLLARAGDSVHVLAIGSWLGALFALRSLTDLREWQRMSATAFVALTTVAASGAFATWRRVGAQSLRVIAESDYGQLLALKVLLVAAVVAVGYASRKRIQRGEIPQASTLRLEFAFACLALITTAWLTGTAPPGE